MTVLGIQLIDIYNYHAQFTAGFVVQLENIQKKIYSVLRLTSNSERNKKYLFSTAWALVLPSSLVLLIRECLPIFNLCTRLKSL